MATPYYVPKIGGVERYVHQLALGLRRDHGHDVCVVSTTPGPRDEVEVDGIRVIRLPVWRTFSNTPVHPAWLTQLRRVFRQEQPDVINTHAPVPGLADACFVARGGRPLIASYHAGSMKKGRRAVDVAIAAYEATALTAIHRRADALVTTFPAREVRGRRDVHHVPPGVDPATFFRTVDDRHDGHTLLYVGRIEHHSAWKGIGTLLEAMVEVAAAHPDVCLRLVGEGDAVADFRTQATVLGLERNVEFVGPLAAADLADMYRSAGVLVLPSETEAESFGMVLIEAMACGTAVVATRVGGPPAVVEDTGGGILADPRSPASLAQAILQLVDDPARRSRLADAGAARVLEKYTWATTVEAYARLIGQVLGG